MRHVIYGDQARLIEFAEARIGHTRFTNKARAIGVGSAAAILAAVVYDRFTPDDCEISIASDGSRSFAGRRFLTCAAAYPFLQLGLERVTAFVGSGNTAALEWCRRNGFVEEGIKRHTDPHRRVVMLGLLRSDCRWLPGHAARQAA